MPNYTAKTAKSSCRGVLLPTPLQPTWSLWGEWRFENVSLKVPKRGRIVRSPGEDMKKVVYKLFV